jgi:hypothetical protein
MTDATDKWATLLSSYLVLEYKYVVGCTQQSVQQGSAVTELSWNTHKTSTAICLKSLGACYG